MGLKKPPNGRCTIRSKPIYLLRRVILYILFTAMSIERLSWRRRSARAPAVTHADVLRCECCEYVACSDFLLGFVY